MLEMSRNRHYPNFNQSGRRIIDKKSPCIRNCCLGEDDICVGCFRNINEIMKWSNSTDEEKKIVLAKADVRKKKRKDKFDV